MGLGELTKLPIDKIVPCPWNMNELPREKYVKLKNWIKECRTKYGKVPLPIVVRPRPKKMYQIIDGEHRWRGHKELGYKDIDSWVYDCDDKQAKLLTNALNYLKGEANPDKEAAYVQDLLSSGIDLNDIVEHTHYTKENLDDLILSSGISVEEVEVSSEGEAEEEISKVPEAWIEMKFSVPVDVAELVEAEIARISSVLTGKNLRGRALEFICVNSSQTPLPDSSKIALRLAFSKKRKTK